MSKTLNERAALVMGFVKKSWGDAGIHWHNPVSDRPMAGWNPIVNYNEAMMLRDKCRDHGLSKDYMRNLRNVMCDTDPEPFTDFANSEQITQAAVEAMEEDNA